MNWGVSKAGVKVKEEDKGEEEVRDVRGRWDYGR